MKDSTKKVLSICGEVLLFLLFIGIFVGGFFYVFRRVEVQIRTNGYFQYIIVGENSRHQDKNNDALAIVGLTAEGLMQENLVIPREIDGHTVEYVGFRDESLFHNDSHRFYAENIKKLYIHENIKEIVYFDCDGADLVVCADTYDVRFTFAYFENIYLNSELYNSSTYSEQIKPANVSFMYNYDDSENEGYYFLDNVEVGGKIFEPIEPKREGYEFTGWYKDAECSMKWDFETDTLPEQIFDDEGKEIYQETKLYAKWIKNS